jgi:hypothetical protein
MRNVVTLLLFFVLLQSCSLNKFVIRQTGTLLDYGVVSLYAETDLVLAEQALASNIKLLEGMVIGDPENDHLLLLTAQALAGYTMGFVEDENPDRAKPLYLRSRDYGLRILRMNSGFAKSENEPFEQYATAIAALGKDEIAALFWTAFAWAGWINLSLDDPQAFVDLPKVQAMMQRVLDLDETYFHASAHLFFGSVWGTKPKLLGGDPEKAKEHFKKNLQITRGNFLIAHIYYAKYYAIKLFDEELFDELLRHVSDTPAAALPGYQFLNMIAKEKAKRLQEMRGEWF